MQFKQRIKGDPKDKRLKNVIAKSIEVLCLCIEVKAKRTKKETHSKVTQSKLIIEVKGSEASVLRLLRRQLQRSDKPNRRRGEID